MTLSTADDLDRTTSGRFVRNLALSLSGGALVTLLGASAAQAQDAGQAGTDSAGTGAAQSGDANAVGNQSSTTETQTVTVSGNLGVIQVINQRAAVSNVGAAVANTGGNIAIGNSSNNTADANQTGTNGLGPASNSGSAANGSNGTATISTGNASAVGNQSNTKIEQVAHGSAHGQLGGILVINQDAVVTNSGVALANSGGNYANGNDSDNTAGLIQDANSAAGVAANDGKATNRSDGLATVNTGAASATGNKSDTQILQSATGSAGGALGGLVIIDQDAFVLNTGAAVANSGGNAAIGNTSDNDADVDQGVGDPNANVIGPIGVASNNGEASNWSGGTAAINTGAATAVGNDSSTKITQNADADITGPGGGSLVSQSSGVVNAGFAVANSGGNFALGNTSDNDADVLQDVLSSGGTDVGVVGNFGLADNQSDGTGLVHSGAANAAGNRSKTDVDQNIEANGGAFNLQTQANLVTNTGLGLANSGLNAGVGNDSDNDSDVDQDATLSDDPGIDVGVVGQFGKASNSSDGTASIETGAATAVGNDSDTTIGQTIDPSGLVVNTQLASVVNAGVGIANSGGNVAVGNTSENGNNQVTQTADIGDGNAVDPTILAGTMVASNNGEASNASDGKASIKTGNATGTGNESGTHIHQDANGDIDGSGAILNTQVAGVANVGLGVANSGLNLAVGNDSDNDADLDQDASVLSDNGGGGSPTLIAGIVTASNDGTASNASDGEATITTGNATGTGNRSETVVDQKADGDIDGLGLVLNTQVAGVLNAGVGIGNSGGNFALGNASDNDADLDQDASVISGNQGNADLTAAFVTAANSGSAENASDGTGDIRTGAAEGTGNASSTHVSQAADGHVSGLGLVLNTQVGAVANVGLGVANSGLNAAAGNLSDNDGIDGADLEQNAEVLSENDGAADGLIVGPATAANTGTATNTSDGTGRIRTGGAQGQGNVSSTFLTQEADNGVDGLGAVISTQVGGVLNAGVGVANSGINGALGNGSENDADLEQGADIGSDNGADSTLNVIGPATASNSGEAANTSDGTAHIGTGGALATGNASATNLTQRQRDDVDDLGLVLGTQIGGVANVGAAVANSGINGAAGNLSDNDIDGVGGGPASQDAGIGSDSQDPFGGTIVGPATAANSGTASNTSDGEACICTGNAVASGNVSSTTLIQDLDLSVGSGLIVMTEAGGVLNAGLGLANTGINGAVGNSSENDVEFNQDSVINDALLPLGVVGPQTASNSGTAANTSNGRGHVGSGNASGTGNQSTTDFVQAATVDSDFAVANIVGGTANAGVGLANTGINLGVGNDSTNTAILDQQADGSGIVSNQGEATNDSDGTAQIGDPTCCDDEGAPTPTPPEQGQPGAPGLPRTGAELEVQATIGLMLLLLGFGLRRRSKGMA